MTDIFLTSTAATSEKNSLCSAVKATALSCEASSFYLSVNVTCDFDPFDYTQKMKLMVAACRPREEGHSEQNRSTQAVHKQADVFILQQLASVINQYPGYSHEWGDGPLTESGHHPSLQLCHR